MEGQGANGLDHRGPRRRAHDTHLDRATAPVTESILRLAEVSSGQTLLDIAAGTGEPAIPAARAVGPTGRVIATDLVDEMLAFAREKASRAGPWVAAARR